jgi:hypothetical protein
MKEGLSRLKSVDYWKKENDEGRTETAYVTKDSMSPK